ncbi:hypothetical protein CANMA_001620 [Candida margitis]|uniref:uncharacterized protein n=1 Tax=Candida margitis TaxID=1775924 RepID=UPI0022269601|nr:uncharacterized protein CANMA_001620 [Candida margitis]KAI5969300.1 hypothetical protein CANMA_001620 [Candida margitis]
MRLDELRTKQRRNYDIFVIKHHLDKLTKPIDEYIDNFYLPNSSLKERKRVTDVLIEKLGELKTSEICTYNCTIPYMLEHEFPIRLSRVISNDKHLFELVTYFIKMLIAYIKSNDCSKFLPVIATILTNHLTTFTNHTSLAPYQLPYANRLVSEVLNICNFHGDILAIWLNNIARISDSNQGIRHHPINLLPLQQIIDNFLINELETFKTTNWEDFVKLSNQSPELNQYLCSQRIDIFDDMASLYFFPSEEYHLLHISVLEPVLSAVINAMEESGPELGSQYFNKFITMFKKHLNLSMHNDDSVIFMLQRLLDLGATKTLGRLVDDFTFQLYLNDKLQDHRKLERFIYVLADVLYRQDQCFLKLSNSKDGTQFLNVKLTFIDHVRKKVMRIHNSDAQPVSQRFAEILTQYSASLGDYNLDNQSPLISSYFQSLLQYFQNKPSLDTSLNHLSLMVFLKFNMLNNATFIEIMHYLIVCFEIYQSHLNFYETYQYDSIEVSKIVAQNVVLPSCEILNHYGIEQHSQSINYVALPMQLDLCRQLITDFYICCKLKGDN